MDLIQCPPRIAEALDLKEGQKVIQVKRKRSDNSEPVSFVKNYLSADIGEKITIEDLQKHSMQHVLKNKLGINLKKGVQYIQAISADYEIAAALTVNMSAPVIYIDSVVFTKDEKPVEYVQSFYRSDRYKYTLNIGLDEIK